MKVFMAFALSVICFSSVAETTLAVNKLTTYLPEGFYEGRNDNGDFCSVSVSEVNFPKKDVLVKVMNPKVSISKLVAENSEADIKDYKREFIQTEKILFGNDETRYVERILRTVATGVKKQFVVISYTVVNNLETQTAEASCIVEIP